MTELLVMPKFTDESLLPANGSFEGELSAQTMAAMEMEAAECIDRLLTVLRIERDHNTIDTPRRVARMLVRETMVGRFAEMPVLTDFPNVRNLNQIYAVGPISVRSLCAHHLVPIVGHAWIGTIPGDRLIGLSKFHRLTNWIMARPQIQEEATEQLADALSDAMIPVGLAVVVRARHLCCSWRGVNDDGSLMTTSIMRGLFKEDQRAREEFMSIIRGSGF